MNDLYRFDIQNWTWTNISRVKGDNGPVPSPRFGAGMASVEGQLFVFGGHGDVKSESIAVCYNI